MGFLHNNKLNNQQAAISFTVCAMFYKSNYNNEGVGQHYSRYCTVKGSIRISAMSGFAWIIRVSKIDVCNLEIRIHLGAKGLRMESSSVKDANASKCPEFTVFSLTILQLKIRKPC